MSTPEYLEFILEQLSGLNGVTYKAMMGEFILYINGRIVGGIYDNRLLVKPVDVAKQLMPDAEMQLPYPGAKPMLLVDNVDNRQFLQNLFSQMYSQLPEPNPKKRI